MARVHYQTRLEVERQFSHRVDIPIPPVVGLGNRINEMEAWCRHNFHAGQWAHHGHSMRQPGQIPEYFARFYLLTAENADLFRQKWVNPMKRNFGLDKPVHSYGQFVAQRHLFHHNGAFWNPMALRDIAENLSRACR